jgi:hypothetical protein
MIPETAQWLRTLQAKWRQDADESSASADAGTMCHDNTVHARGMAMAFTACADELEAVLVRAEGVARSPEGWQPIRATKHREPCGSHPNDAP